MTGIDELYRRKGQILTSVEILQNEIMAINTGINLHLNNGNKNKQIPEKPKEDKEE